MTPAKIASLLQGQTSIARKLFEFVPIAEEWTEFQIASEMRRVTGSAPDLKVARGCLRDLADSGLIRRRNDQFRRAAAPDKTPQKEAEMPAAKSAERLIVLKASEIPLKSAAKPERPAEASPIEILGDIAGSIVALSKGVAEQLQQLASRVEEAAIQIEQGQEANAANLQKLKQLQQLLRSLGDEA